MKRSLIICLCIIAYAAVAVLMIRSLIRQVIVEIAQGYLDSINRQDEPVQE